VSDHIQITLANPRGFCAGVDRAITIVERALEMLKPPIYVRHEVVHNRFVVDKLRKMGAVFVQELDEVPDNSVVIFSAHGVSQRVQHEAKSRQLQVFDATCPLVTKVHLQVIRASRRGQECILIGHAGHPEVEGTMGQYNHATSKMYLVESIEQARELEVNDPDNLIFVTQTTLSMDDTQAVIDVLKQRYPSIQAPRKDDICYATQNRQDAVKQIAGTADLMLVVGSKNSSNSNRLREIAEKMGTKAYLIDDASQICHTWFDGVAHCAVTAGASAPEVLVQAVIDKIISLHDVAELIEFDGKPETVSFEVPASLRIA
jgi:4-hydroxy-3-methylbut-2-en-1-yl diphosphate reductase